MIAELKNCTVCGSRLNGAVAGLGAVCPSCIVRAVRTPCVSHADTVSEDVDTTTWADVFPQFRIERVLRKSDETPVYLARVEDEEPRKRVVIQIVTGEALEEAGGAPELTVRARRLAACSFDGLLPVLDFGDLSDAFFLATEAREEPLLSDALAGADCELSADLLAALDSCGRRLTSETSEAGVGFHADPILAFGDIDSGTCAIHFTPSVLPAGSSPMGQSSPSPAAFTAQPAAKLGPFVLEEKLGEGGFGEVWRARQQQPAERQVALKILKQGLHSSRARARFDLEQAALARLDHPHIARLYEAGTTSDGRPFFAMEWVDGTTLNRFWKDGEAPLDRRLELFAQVCRAVEHAHLKGILHRDLKPSNVMVATEGESASAKVIDFGIARALEDPGVDQTLLTRPFDLMGTPVYMSPEQIAASGEEADARSDVYSLGVTLYEALCARLPFDPNLPLPKLQRAILDDEPLRPSQRLADHAQSRRVRGDLDWITLKCLEKDPARRYQSVGALLLDIERYAKNEAVEAGPPELAYRVRKFVSRNRVTVAAATTVTLALVVGLILATVGFSRARHEAVKAREAEKETETALLTTDRALTDTRVSTAFLNSDLAKESEAALWLAYAAVNAQDPERAGLNKRRFIEWMRMVDVPIAAIQLEDPWRWGYDLTFSPGDELLRIISFHGEEGETSKEVRLLPVFDSERFEPVANRIWGAADVHPSEPWIALIDSEGVLSLFDWKVGTIVASVQLFEGRLSDVAFSRDGKHLAVAGQSTGAGGSYAVAVLPVDHLDAPPRWKPLTLFPRYLAWSLDSRTLLAGAGMDDLFLFKVDPVDGSLEPRLDQPLNDWRSLSRNGSFPALRRPIFSADGTSFYLTHEARRFDLETGALLDSHPRVYGNPIRAATLAPNLTGSDPEEVFYASQGPRILALNLLVSGTVPEYRFSDKGYLYCLQASPDGASLLGGGNLNHVYLWNREPGREEERRTLGIWQSTASKVAFSDRGNLVATANQVNRSVRVWRRALTNESPDLYFPVAWTSPAGAGNWKGWNHRKSEQISGFSPATAWGPTRTLVNKDASLLVPIPLQAGGKNSMAATASWRLPDGAMEVAGFANGRAITAGAFSPIDPRLLVTGHYADGGGVIIRWNATTGEEVGERLPLPASPRGVAISPDGQGLATVCDGGEVFVADLNPPHPEVQQIAERESYVETWSSIHGGQICYSPDGRFLFTWGMHGLVRCFEEQSGHLLYRVKSPTGAAPCRDVLFGPDGLLGLAWAQSNEVKWINLETGEPALVPVLRHPAQVHDLLLSSDQESLITACDDGLVRVWNWRTGELHHSFDYGGRVFSVDLTEDGYVVAGAGSGEDGYLQAWDPRTGLPVTPKWRIGNVRSVKVIRRDGRELVLAGVAEGGVFGFDLGKHFAHQSLTETQCLRLGEVISGRKILSTGTVTRMDATEWLQRWESLTEEERRFLAECHPTNETSWHRWMSDRPTARPIRDWHRERLRAIDPVVAAELDLVEARREAAAARAAREQAAQAAFQSGDEAAQKGEWLEARRNFKKGRDGIEALGGSVDANVLRSLAVALFKLGDTDAYLEVCETWVERYQMSDDPRTLRTGSRLCLGSPALRDKAVWQEAIAMARRSLEGLAPESSDYQFGALALGLAEIREGNLDPAIEWLKIAAKGPDYCRIPAHAYHAIGAARAGQWDEAVGQLREAEESLAQLSEDAGPAASWIGSVFAEMAIEEARAELAREGSE